MIQRWGESVSRFRSKRAIWLSVISLVIAAGQAATAGETITYSYDPRGRLSQVARSGTVNNNLKACYTYDRGDNRNNVAVDTAACVEVPRIEIGFATAVEGSPAVFTVTKRGATSGSIGINYSTADGTALATSDYTATSGSLTFGPTEYTKTITVPTTTNATSEGPERFYVNLTLASGAAQIVVSQGQGLIDDNDFGSGKPSFSVEDACCYAEGSPMVFSVTRTSSAGDYSVNYATANGTASTADYTPTSGTLYFPDGVLVRNVYVYTIEDSASESNETILLNISGATGGAAISDAQGSGRIYNDD
jgi:hypothetical protein